MTSKRVFYVMCGLVALLVLGLFGSAYYVDNLMVTQSNKLKKQRLQTQTLDAESTALTSAKRDITKYKDLSIIAKSIVPEDKDQAQTVREIVNIAAANGIDIGSITFPTSSLGSTSGTTSTLSTSTTNTKTSQLTPVAGISGVYYLPITVQSSQSNTVSYNQFIGFLNDLEHNRRTALVSTINLTPDQNNNNNVSFTLTLDEYIKP